MFAKSLIISAIAAASAQTMHMVSVGESGLVYSPASLVAAVGDYVVFNFYGQHNVIQQNLERACQPKDSGLFSTSMSEGNYTIQIKDTQPIYFYCSIGRHCSNGMVGAINPADGAAAQLMSGARAYSGAPGMVQGGVRGNAVPLGAPVALMASMPAASMAATSAAAVATSSASSSTAAAAGGAAAVAGAATGASSVTSTVRVTSSAATAASSAATSAAAVVSSARTSAASGVASVASAASAALPKATGAAGHVAASFGLMGVAAAVVAVL